MLHRLTHQHAAVLTVPLIIRNQPSFGTSTSMAGHVLYACDNAEQAVRGTAQKIVVLTALATQANYDLLHLPRWRTLKSQPLMPPTHQQSSTIASTPTNK